MSVNNEPECKHCQQPVGTDHAIDCLYGGKVSRASVREQQLCQCSTLEWLPEHQTLEHHPDCPEMKALDLSALNRFEGITSGEWLNGFEAFGRALNAAVEKYLPDSVRGNAAPAPIRSRFNSTIKYPETPPRSITMGVQCVCGISFNVVNLKIESIVEAACPNCGMVWFAHVSRNVPPAP